MFKFLHLLLCVLILLSICQNKSLSSIQFSDELLASVRKRYGQEGFTRVLQWQRLTTDLHQRSAEEKLYEVNKFFNQVSFVSDIEHWGEKDYWATPVEFLGTNAGDCEDFVIAKYFTLVHIGIPKEKLRFLYVTATKPQRQAHMVLAYYPDTNAVPFILDNIKKQIQYATSRRDLLPIYSFNADGLWAAKEQGRGKKIRGQNNNNLWKDLNNRMMNE